MAALLSVAKCCGQEETSKRKGQGGPLGGGGTSLEGAMQRWSWAEGWAG